MDTKIVIIMTWNNAMTNYLHCLVLQLSLCEFFIYLFLIGKGQKKSIQVYMGFSKKSMRPKKDTKRNNPTHKKTQLNKTIVFIQHSPCRRLSTLFTLSAQKQRDWITANLTLFAENVAFSNIPMFLSFQIAQQKKMGAAVESKLPFFWAGDNLQ